MTWVGMLCVAAGAFVGGTTRYALTTALRGTRTGDAAGTTTVNALGSLVLGALAHLLARHAIDATPYALLGTGFCGALTTWSTLARGVADRVRDRDARDAGIYLGLNLLLGLLSVTLGWDLAG